MPFNHPTARAVHEALMNVAQSGAWRTYHGPFTEKLRELLGQTFQRQHVRLCSSGTLGVELAVRALKLPKDAEVLLAAYDFPGNFRAIEDAGARVALCDNARDGWSVSVQELEHACGANTRAIIVSHLHGSLAPMKSICEWAQAKGLFVIEDACQEPGAIVDDGCVGTWGDISVLSFGGSKILSAGRGGAVLTNDASLAQRMTIFCERGNDAFAISELQAAVLIPQVQALKDDNHLRRNALKRLQVDLQTWDWLRLVPFHESEQPACYKVGIELLPAILPMASAQRVVQARDIVLAKLVEAGVEAGSGFPGFLNRSSNRCRRSVPLDRSRLLSESTMVLSHTHLLDPHTGVSTIDRIVAALEHIQSELVG